MRANKLEKRSYTLDGVKTIIYDKFVQARSVTEAWNKAFASLFGYTTKEDIIELLKKYPEYYVVDEVEYYDESTNRKYNYYCYMKDICCI